MQKAFDLIVERLEELKKKDCTKKQDDHYVVKNTKDLMRLAYNNAIEIVNQVAEEYKSTEHISCSTEEVCEWVEKSD